MEVSFQIGVTPQQRVSLDGKEEEEEMDQCL